MKKILTKFKNFWKKGKKQKAIIVIAVIAIIGIVLATTNYEKEVNITITLEIDKSEAKIGDIITYDYHVESDTDDKIYMSDYDAYLNFDHSVIEYDNEQDNFKVIGSGKTDITITMKKDDKKFVSNKATLTVEDKVVSISATYYGSTKAGTKINDNAYISVTGTTETNNEIKLSDWKVSNPSELVAEETSTFQITYEDLSCDLQITCTSLKPMTTGQSNAYRSANSYLKTMPFSRSGLIKQLEYEGYSTEDATFAVDKCNVDWNEQAAKSAKKYIEIMSFSRSGLISQLKYEGYTQEQAEYGVSAAGY